LTSYNIAIAHLAETVRLEKPLVHCITNYVTVNDCANALLAVGGSPVMADDIAEAEAIASICASLVINIGTLNGRTVESMLKAGKKAASLGRPVILDPVGAGASALRTETALRLISEIPFSVIRGNASEIRTVLNGSGTTRGVDAGESDAKADSEDPGALLETAKELSRRTGAVIVATGKRDIVTNGKMTLVSANGHERMTRITGTGCMLSAITGAYCGAKPSQILHAAAAAVCAMGLAGEIAAAECDAGKTGTGSFRMHLIDALSLMTGGSLLAGMKLDLS
jgi:hydroxyethylthiazole kinase